MSPVPDFPFRGKDAPDRASEHLAKSHGIDTTITRHRLHKLKAVAGLGPPDDVMIMIGRTGDVYVEATGEQIGTPTAPSLGQD